MIRAQHKNDAERIVDRAVSVARRVAPRVSNSVPVDSPPVTWSRVAGDGTVRTVHWFMVGVDAVGDEDAPVSPL